MYLKALEIQGFKSFPERTRLSFERDVTAIVGPNGSGKSNISDAILWVMGEQSSRTLRGGKMQDVIFGGTARRAAMGVAQVTLVLDNTARLFDIDADEVAITRKYYRSGESEYYINRQQVRLRDVNELLMDTGLGRDGYSIIGQGRIAEIVSGKSAERREVLEEAAGISRYRYRKEEAERRLQRTDENLLRVNDKIEELELQVKPLKEQAEVAKRYLALRDELKRAEVSLWMTDLDALREQADAVESEYAETKAALEAAQARAAGALFPQRGADRADARQGRRGRGEAQRAQPHALARRRAGGERRRAAQPGGIRRAERGAHARRAHASRRAAPRGGRPDSRAPRAHSRDRQAPRGARGGRREREERRRGAQNAHSQPRARARRAHGRAHSAA